MKDTIRLNGGKLQVWADWENDGMLRWKGDTTLKKYRELCEERNHIDMKKYQCFFAFSSRQFEEGLKALSLPEGTKLVRSSYGLTGTREGMGRLYEEYDRIRKRIVDECDPQEVYLYEYNNHECCIDWDGDERAIRYIIDYWGADVAKNIMRCNAMRKVDEIAADG